MFTVSVSTHASLYLVQYHDPPVTLESFHSVPCVVVDFWNVAFGAPEAVVLTLIK